MKVWAVSLLTMKLSPHSLTPRLSFPAFGVWLNYLGKTHDSPSSALPPENINLARASPKAISGRTSYYQARLAFHFLPQLIPRCCTTYGFGPPPAFRRDSPWPWQARLASGLKHIALLKIALLTLAFAVSSGQNPLEKKLRTWTRWLVLQKARSHPLRGSNSLWAKWFQVLFHRPHRATFHLSLTVLVHYRRYRSI